MAKRRAAAPVPERQQEQERLLEEARRQPGVADAIEAYERLATAAEGYRRKAHNIRFATGGNYPADPAT